MDQSPPMPCAVSEGPVPAGAGGAGTGRWGSDAFGSGTVQNGNALAFYASGSAGLPDRLEVTHATTRAAIVDQNRGWRRSRG